MVKMSQGKEEQLLRTAVADHVISSSRLIVQHISSAAQQRPGWTGKVVVLCYIMIHCNTSGVHGPQEGRKEHYPFLPQRPLGEVLGGSLGIVQHLISVSIMCSTHHCWQQAQLTVHSRD